MTERTVDRPILRRLAPAFALVLAWALGACGPNLIRGESPFVQVSSWQVEGDRLAIELRLRNVNEVTLDISGIQFQVSVDGTRLANHDAPIDVGVIASGFETIRVSVQASDEGLRMLERLQNGLVDSLPYELTGRLRLADGKPLSIRREGHIYRVPGRPGQFR